MSKQQTRRAIIEYKVAKPFVDAAALGLGSSAFAVVLQGPALNWALIGSGFSLFWYWGSSNLTTKKTKQQARRAAAESLVVNSARGSHTIKRGGEFEYQPGYVSRETWGGIISRLLFGGDERSANSDIVAQVPPEFVFRSRYDGQPVDLREDDVRRFLRTAWKHRQRGRGLSQRRWVREWRERPQWYKDLGPYWYYAFLDLLREAQKLRRCQLVVCIGPQWYALARDPHITLGILREAEAMKGGVSPPHTDVIDISTDRGESSF